jgi:hypothetical protein
MCRADMSENMPQKESEVFEEIGIDTDEAQKTSYRAYDNLLPKRRR